MAVELVELLAEVATVVVLLVMTVELAALEFSKLVVLEIPEELVADTDVEEAVEAEEGSDLMASSAAYVTLGANTEALLELVLLDVASLILLSFFAELEA